MQTPVWAVQYVPRSVLKMQLHPGVNASNLGMNFNLVNLQMLMQKQGIVCVYLASKKYLGILGPELTCVSPELYL